jgi:hypothetical protein
VLLRYHGYGPDYGNDLGVAVTLVTYENVSKKGRPSITHRTLAAVSIDPKNITTDTLEALVREKRHGMPALITIKYAVPAEDAVAERIFEEVASKPPLTASNLAEVLGQYAHINRIYTPPNPTSLFPDPALRRALGR